MNINKIKILFALFFKSSNLLLKVSVIFLPLIMALSFSSIIFVSNLSHSYKNYLLKSYIGVEGVLSVNSKNFKYLQLLRDEYDALGVQSSFKSVVRRELSIKTKNYVLQKKIKIIILEDAYLRQKFHLKTNVIVINNIFKDILGTTKDISIKSLGASNYMNFKSVESTDTGFLSSEALIFISKELFQKLGFKFVQYNYLELNILQDEILKMQNIAKKVSENEHGVEMSLVNVLSKHQETKELFKNIQYIEFGILGVSSLLSFIILMSSLSIIANIKQKAITLLRVYGLSTLFISITLTLMSSLLFIISLTLASLFFHMLQDYFLSIIDFSSAFFIPLEANILYNLAYIVLMFLVCTYIWSYLTFKGKIKI